MRRFALTMSVFGTLGSVALIACSSGGGGGVSSGGGAFTTSVSGSKALSELTDEEKLQFCNDAAAFYTRTIPSDRAKRSSCANNAYIKAVQTQPTSDQDLQSKCSSAYQECLASSTFDAGSSGTIDVNVSSCTKSKGLANCTATVREFVACYQDLVNAQAARSSADTLCSRIHVDGGTDSLAKTPTPASCTAISSRCPDLVD